MFPNNERVNAIVYAMRQSTLRALLDKKLRKMYRSTTLTDEIRKLIANVNFLTLNKPSSHMTINMLT